MAIPTTLSRLTTYTHTKTTIRHFSNNFTKSYNIFVKRYCHDTCKQSSVTLNTSQAMHVLINFQASACDWLSLKSYKHYIFWACVCCLRYPTRKAHSPDCIGHLWPARLYHILPHYLLNGTTSGKKLLIIRCMFRVFLQICLKNFSFYEECSAK